MSSVSVGWEVLAVVAFLIIVAVVCCCVGFCVFHIMQQETQRIERMMAYHWGQSENEEVMQNNGNVTGGSMNQVNDQGSNQPESAPSGTTTTKITITTTVTTPPTQPTPTQAIQPSQAEHTYTGATHRLPAARRMDFTADDNDNQSQPSAQPVTNNESDDVKVLSESVKETSRKTFQDHSKGKMQVSQEPQKTEETEEKKKQADEFEIKQVKPLKNFRNPRQRTRHTPVWVLAKGKKKLSLDEYMKKWENVQQVPSVKTSEESQESHDIGRSNLHGFDSNYMKEWRFIRRKQMGCINAERDGWVGLGASDPPEERNDTSLMTKKTK